MIISERKGSYLPDIVEIKLLLNPIAKEYGVKRLYLFGSFAKGTSTPQSDVDLLVEKGKPISLLKLSGMRLKCEEALQRPVDLVTTAGIEEDFKNQISGTEILLYEE